MADQGQELSPLVPATPRPAWSGAAAGGVFPRANNRGMQQEFARLHSMYGNQAVLRMLSHSSPAIQTKLAVNQPGDPFEQEADRVADQVMRMPAATTVQRSCSACHKEDKLQRKCAECEEEEKQTGLQKKEAGAGPQFAPPSVYDVLNSPGQPLDPASRGFMEPRFGYDFSHVRVHTGSKASESAQSVNALAYTFGPNVVFGAGKYSPASSEGGRLLAHELTHVVQQGGGSRDIGPVADGPQVQRLVRTSSVTCPAAAAGIANPHTGSADRRASSLLDKAITRITNAQAARVASPADPDVIDVGNALHTVFHFDAANAATWTLPAPDVRLPVILRRLQMAKNYIDSVVFTVHCIPVGGAGYTIPGCPNDHCAGGGDNAFSCPANAVELVLCPDFWAQNLDQRGRTWMHEVMHINFQFIEDWSQPNVHNAHCYAQFVLLLNGLNSPKRCP